MRKLHIPGRSNVIGMNGVAATSQPLSSLEAINILKKGGNAIDAVIATQLALNLVEPQSSGIGGGGFLLFCCKKNKQKKFFDGFKKLPIIKFNFTDTGSEIIFKNS